VGFLSFESNWPKLKRKLAPSSGDEKSADIYTQASLDPERNQRNIDKLKQKAVQRGHIL